jgi:hypothetical protein
MHRLWPYTIHPGSGIGVVTITNTGGGGGGVSSELILVSTVIGLGTAGYIRLLQVEVRECIWINKYCKTPWISEY